MNIQLNYQKTQDPQKVPLAVLSKLKETFNCLENAGVITKLGYPTKWVNVLVIVGKKDCSLRLCLDPKDLNNYILEDFKRLPSLKKSHVNCRTKNILLLLI